MKAEKTILIADRNPHVREFLRRELSAADYHVRLAENGKDLLSVIYEDIGIRLVILDPDFPDTDRQGLLDKLQNRLPLLPVILHTYASDCDGLNLAEMFSLAVIIEKSGDSVEQLKKAVFDILDENG
ncbi:MAG: response regulator [Desulfococcaceae bacterium]|nr:response regulator [Desulfococcaceae bacterium]